MHECKVGEQTWPLCLASTPSARKTCFQNKPYPPTESKEDQSYFAFSYPLPETFHTKLTLLIINLDSKFLPSTAPKKA